MSEPMIALTERERIARLETEVRNVRSDMDEIKSDVKAILRKFDEMTGGKKALLGLVALIGALVGIVAGVVGMLFGGGHHP